MKEVREVDVGNEETLNAILLLAVCETRTGDCEERTEIVPNPFSWLGETLGDTESVTAIGLLVLLGLEDCVRIDSEERGDELIVARSPDADGGIGVKVKSTGDDVVEGQNVTVG